MRQREEFTCVVNCLLEVVIDNATIDQNMPEHKVFDFKGEEEEFVDEFNLVIDIPEWSHADDTNNITIPKLNPIIILS